jgi:ATP-dependent Lon protease
MKKDSAIKTRSQTKKTKKEEAARLRKHNDTSSDSDYDSESEEDENEEELDMHEYRKFLAKTFPSKHMNKKVNAGKKLQKALKEDYSEQSSSTNDDESESDEEYIPKKNKSKPKEKKNKSKKVVSSEEEEDDSESEAEETVEEDSEEESEEEEIVSKKKSIKSPTHKKSSKFNIIFTIGDKRSKKNNYIDDEDEDEDEWDTCSDEDYDEDEDEEEQVTENEDDPISSSEDEVDDDEKDEKDVTESKSSSSSKNEKNKRLEKDKKIEKSEVDDSSVNVKNVNQTSSEKESDILKALKELQIKNKDKDDKLISQCIKACEEKIEVNKKSQEKKMKKYKERNGRIFKRILHDKNTMNDFDFFEKMEPNNQKKIIKEMREINKITRIEKPYRLTLLESDIPTNLKGAAMKKISSLRYMEPGSGEYYKIKNWVDTFMRLPFGNYKTLPISIDDGVEACHDFMANAQKTLNEAVYGLNDAKMQIMQLLGQLVTNPKSIGTAIAIHGPAGTGKTSIVKEGISKILNRPFAFIALGGATDSSFLEGHGYTYEGSTWGKIVQILIDSKCMNPVIYFDELDKISETPKGEEITGILTHLTDTTQNSQFHDKYFSEIDFDLSKCLFIFSYNDESKVNPILKDRMYRIQTKGYNQKQKTVISNDYLLPRIREQVKFKNDDIIIPPDVIHYIIDNFCGKEDGVRNLKRCYEIIYTKLNLYRLMRPDSNLFEEDMSLKVEFPFTVTKIIVDKLIKGSKENISALHNLYV